MIGLDETDKEREIAWGAKANPYNVRESAYDALFENRQNFNTEAEYDDRATWVIHVACFHHSCFSKGVCRCLKQDVVI